MTVMHGNVAVQFIPGYSYVCFWYPPVSVTSLRFPSLTLRSGVKLAEIPSSGVAL
jgi:hypothetical protein